MEKGKKPGYGLGFWCDGMLTLPVLYFLSVGPIVWMVHRGMVSSPTIDLLEKGVYAPLFWLVENNASLKTAYEWYALLWLP